MKYDIKYLINRDKVYIARLFLLDKVYNSVAVFEKSAQGASFGPFEYKEIKENFKNDLLNARQSNEKEIKAVIETGKFNFTYKFRNTNKTSLIDLTDLNISEKTSRTPAITGEVCWKQFIKWIDNLLKRLEDYMAIPDCVKLAVDV